MTTDKLGKVRSSLDEIVQWSEAYPVDIFHEPTPEQVDAVCKTLGFRIDAISAMVLRAFTKHFGQIAREAIAIIDAEPAPVTDKDQEEKSEPKYSDKDWSDAENVFDHWFTGYECFAAAEIARIRKAAYKEGLRDGSKRE